MGWIKDYEDWRDSFHCGGPSPAELERQELYEWADLHDMDDFDPDYYENKEE